MALNEFALFFDGIGMREIRYVRKNIYPIIIWVSFGGRGGSFCCDRV